MEKGPGPRWRKRTDRPQSGRRKAGRMKGPARIAPLAFTLLLLACKSQRPVVQGTTRELPPRGPAELLLLVNAGRTTDIRHYNAKAELEMAADSTDTQSAKARIQLVVDSAAWIKVMGPLGIEGG